MSEFAIAEEHYDWCMAEAVDAAEKSGMLVVKSSPDRLLLDIDDIAALARYQSGIQVLRAYFGLIEIERWKSKTYGHWHIVVQCYPIASMPLRIALQLVLGSDPKREALALMMDRDGIENPSVLFRPKEIPQ